jgi:hypothetical protein
MAIVLAATALRRGGGGGVTGPACDSTDSTAVWLPDVANIARIFAARTVDRPGELAQFPSVCVTRDASIYRESQENSC